jgi:uncharacterized membrane protein
MEQEPPRLPRLQTRHPLHPVFTHFPLALMGVAPLWDLIGLLRGEPLWWQLSFWCMAAGLAAAVPALGTGLVDHLAVPERSPAQWVVNRHVAWVLAAVGLFAVNLVVRGGTQPPVGLYRTGAVCLSAAGLVPLGIGGWYGGELVYRHGIGQRRPPGDPQGRP